MMMAARWHECPDGKLVRVWYHVLTDDAVVTSDHPYGTCGSTRGHEGHWVAPYPPSATVEEAA